MLGRTPAGSTARRVVTGLALLALVVAGCSVAVEVEPDAIPDVGSASDTTEGDAPQAGLDPVLSSEDAQTAAEGAVNGTLDAADQPDGAVTGDGSRVDTAAERADPPPAPPPIDTTQPADAASTEDAPTPATVAATTAEGPTETTIPADSATAAPSDAAGTTAPSAAPGTPDDPEPPPAEDLHGEPYEFGPDEGESLAVVGVDHDDVLNVRDVPFGEIIATLGLANPIAFVLEVRAMPSGEPIDWFDSWSGAIVATGRTRKLPTTVWHEVQVAGVTGWASGAYLAPIGLTDDITAHLIDRLGERPEADTLIDLALIVGEAFASSEPPSRVVVTVGPIIFEGLGEITVDVLNIGDDSLLGYRLHIFAIPAAEDWMSEDPGPFTLRTVERTIICHSHRGVTADGLCV